MTVVEIEAERQRVLGRCHFLTTAHVWPISARIHPERWLANFSDAELPHALRLLESFLFYPTEMVNAMLSAVVQGLAPIVIQDQPGTPEFRSAWVDFQRDAVFTHVSGEEPNSSDSGHLFVRKLRQEVGVPETSLYYHAEAIERLRTSNDLVIFVDDFAGSGQQFIHTWKENVVALADGSERSFADSVDPTRAIYCPLICTDYGASEIRRECPGVRIVPAHFLPEVYSALSPESVLWTDHLRPTAVEFIDVASDRAGIPKALRFGFHELGLALAFDHSVPDATLPLIYWEEENWQPLVLRT